jgi:hypothetical protein
MNGKRYLIALAALAIAGAFVLSVNVSPSAADGRVIGAPGGCALKCIRKAVPVAIGPTAAVFAVETTTPATIQLIVASDPKFQDIVSDTSSPPRTTAWTTGASLLAPGTVYAVLIRATDADGRTQTVVSWFKTRPRTARVTLWKIKVIDDGDKGSARGELRFDYWAGGKLLSGTGFHKRDSGDTVAIKAAGSSRQGLTVDLAANGPSPLVDLRVFGEECDGHARMKNCVFETYSGEPSGGGDLGGNDTATAGGSFSLGSMLTGGALPPNFGTDMPAGHNGYFAFETTQHHVKFRVYAYVDVVYR